ncbi:hypothetical protein C8J57DRAFT_1496843 [Mycena rebaudengoi]|nr:hypothetical protein C8J57DRAFT_1496843 [Mycena rebaudengoi]
MIFTAPFASILLLVAGATASPVEDAGVENRGFCGKGNFWKNGVCTPCSPGTYQSYDNQNFCYGAPSGRFQSKGGQSKVCGVCCGWYTKLQNNNVQIYKCPAGTSSGRSSGSGCTTQGVGCTKVNTCVQASNGACPDQSFTG